MQTQEFDTGLEDCRAAAVLPDAPIAVLANRAAIATVDLDSGAAGRMELADEWGVKAIAGLSANRVLVANIKTVVLYDLAQGPVGSWDIESWGATLDVAATPSGSVFAVAAGDRFYTGGIGRYDLASTPSPNCLAVAVSADGALVAAGRDGFVDVYQRGGLTRSLGGGDIPALSIGLAPGGRRLMTCDDNTDTAMFDLDTGARTPLDTAGKAVAMRWSPDGTTCAAIALTRLVGLLDADGGHRRHLEPPERGTYYLLGGGWTPDGKRIAAGTEHGKIVSWSL
jgi:WD40 repeat protein